jgi:hypothetical protein
LSILIGRLSNGIRSFGPIRLRLQEEGIPELGLLDELVKSGILCILLKGTKERRDGCSGVVFMDIHKGLVYFRRRIGV